MFILLAVPVLGLAQDDETEAQVEDEGTIDNIVVTGSRIKRDTYTSIAPLQVITSQISREVGLIDAATILQDSPAASGGQIDLNFSTFVTPDGPGASTISLRGLGPARTLVLLNGRRVAPSGVEGAPASPDLNMIPGSLVQQYDLLLDGASSIYGSDAVAGVTNIILRKDFDGFEFEAFSNIPDQSSGVSNVLSVMWGKNSDRGFFGIGAEYEDSESVSLADRRWTANCYTHREIDENGMIRTQEAWYTAPNGIGFNMEWDECALDPFISARIIAPLFGSVYSTPGSSNMGLPGWTESSFPGRLMGADANGDGVTDISFRNYDLNGKDQGSHLFPEFSRKSVMAYGEYTMEGEMNLTPFFEASYNQRDYYADTREGQFFPVVSADNPFNPCNPAGVRGVDCGLAWDNFVTNPNIVTTFQDVHEAICAASGFSRDQCVPALFGQGPVGAIGPQPVRVVATVDGDRSKQWADVEQYRFVFGMRGDLPDFGPGSSEDWSFEMSLTTSQSNGISSILGIREDRLQLTANTTIEDPNNPGTFICGVDDDGDGIPDGTDGCVAVDLFAPSLYPPGTVIGEFATQAERDYLFDSRDFNTKYFQTIWSAFLTGDLLQMPSGPLSVVFGFEYRDDEIKSIPDEVAREGLFTAFFADGGATGRKFTREYYAEVEFPLLANVTAAEELSLNLSARHTTDELYGSDTTYSAKVGWLPIRSLLFRATYGTSFRAPNLRENFLIDQTGFGTIFDPCVTPDEAIDDITGNYNPALDNRDPAVLQNCFDNGVDPTMLDVGFSAYPVEIASAGVTDITAETSESWSAGFSFEQPWSESFSLVIGATYYEIDIDDAIVEPSPQFIVSDCYTKETFDSVFCERLTRDSDGLLDFIDAGFINRDNSTVRGFDINIAFDMDMTIGTRAVTLGADIYANRGLENSDLFIATDGTPSFDEDQGQWGLPDWRGRFDIRADVGDYRFTWRTNYLGKVAEDPDSVDDFDDVIGPPGLSDTCLGPTQGDVQCRDIAFADDYMIHTTSLYYYGDVWTFGAGIRNVFDEEPKIADQAKNFIAFNSISGVVIGRGYDLQGRTYFVNVAANFGGGL